MRNGLVIFRNTHVKSYNCPTKEIDISHPETANDLVEISVNKPTNKAILTPLNYLKSQRPCQHKQP